MTSIQVNWQPTTETTYWKMLEVLPPALMNPGCFLVGEPFDHGHCAVTGDIRPRYEAFIQIGDKLRLRPGAHHSRIQAFKPAIVDDGQDRRESSN